MRTFPNRGRSPITIPRGGGEPNFKNKLGGEEVLSRRVMLSQQSVCIRRQHAVSCVCFIYTYKGTSNTARRNDFFFSFLKADLLILQVIPGIVRVCGRLPLPTVVILLKITPKQQLTHNGEVTRDNGRRRSILLQSNDLLLNEARTSM